MSPLLAPPREGEISLHAMDVIEVIDLVYRVANTPIWAGVSAMSFVRLWLYLALFFAGVSYFFRGIVGSD